MSELNQHSENDQNEEVHHIVSPAVYLVIVLTLMALTAVTVAASFIEMGMWNPIVALGIAVIKATLVVLFFMHVKYSTKLTQITIIAGIFIFLGLISMTLADYISRAWGRW